MENTDFTDSTTLLTIYFIKGLCYYTDLHDAHSIPEKKQRTS